MNLEATNFALGDIEAHGMGAGVIPVSTDSTGQIHLLLGRERWMPAWRGSCRWSGFEGSRKPTETMIEAAEREFLEESMGTVRVADDDDTATIGARLRARDYCMRVVLRITNERRPERYHTTYVVRVPWDATVVTRFQRTRSDIEHIDRLLQEWTHTRPTDLLGAPTEDVGPIERRHQPPAEEDAEDDPAAVVWRPRPADSCILGAPWILDPDDPTHLVRAHIVDGVRASRLLAWTTLRERLTRAVGALAEHPCVTVRRDARWNLVQEVHIHRDHLEKDQVRWWSVPDLTAAVAARGHHGPDRFRPYFLPVLQTILTQLRAPHTARVRSAP